MTFTSKPMTKDFWEEPFPLTPLQNSKLIFWGGSLNLFSLPFPLEVSWDKYFSWPLCHYPIQTILRWIFRWMFLISRNHSGSLHQVISCLSRGKKKLSLLLEKNRLKIFIYIPRVPITYFAVLFISLTLSL